MAMKGERELDNATSYRPLRQPVAHLRIQGALAYGILAFSLAACQTPAVQTRTVEVKVPVLVQPVTRAQVPTVPDQLPPRPKSLSAAADLLASKWCEAVSYFLRADPLLRVSAGEQPGALPKYPECERR